MGEEGRKTSNQQSGAKTSVEGQMGGSREAGGNKGSVMGNRGKPLLVVGCWFLVFWVGRQLGTGNWELEESDCR